MEVKRYWVPNGTLVDQSGWHHDDTQVVQAWDFDRILAERDALQQRLNAVEDENDRLRTQPAMQQGEPVALPERKP